MKKNYLIKSIIILVICILLNNLYASGRVGLVLLNLNNEGKGSALSGAVVSEVSGGRSIYYNPAGLAELEYDEVSFSYTRWIENINIMNLGYATKKFNKILYNGNICGNVIFMDEGELSKIGIEESDGYTMRSSSYGINIGYGKKISNFDFGLGLKFINNTIFGKNSFAALLDIGIQKKYLSIPKSALKIGASIRNLGFLTSVLKDSDLPPIQFSVAGSYLYSLKNNNYITLLAQIDNSIEVPFTFRIGAEYSIKNQLFLRLGYSLINANMVEKYNGLSFGLGLISKRLNIDFAFIPVGIFGNSFQISGGLKF